MSFQEKVRNQSGWVKFGIVSGVIGLYLLYVIWKHGIKHGIILTFLMWSFFVYCTPIADAGILVSLPIKFVLNVKMQITQLFVYLAAGIIIFLSYFFEEDVFHFTYPTRLLHRILKHPFSLYGLIIIVSFVGTMLSAVIEDEIYNYIAEKKIHTKKSLFITYCVITGVCWIIFFWLLYHYHINIKKIY